GVGSNSFVRADAIGSTGSGHLQFSYPVGATSSSGRVVWVGDCNNYRLVCLAVRGHGLCSRLRWIRAVPFFDRVVAPYCIGIGARRGQMLVRSGISFVDCEVDSEWKLTRRRPDRELNREDPFSRYTVVCGPGDAVYIIVREARYFVKVMNSTGDEVASIPAD